MSRPMQNGLIYFSFDVDFFSDKKIKTLKSKYGSDGVILYLYLLCEIYRDQGYYIQVDEDFEHILSEELNMSFEKIGQMMNFLLGRSLFNDTLFKSDKVLTSIEIQRRYQEGIKARALKKSRTVNGKFWLLSKEETQSFIKVQPDLNKSEKNPDKSEKNATKESKEKKRKVSMKIPFEKIYLMWNQICSHKPVDYQFLHASRERKLLSLLGSYTETEIRTVFTKVRDSDFLSGSNWCDFDWVVKQENFEKILLGKYDNEQQTEKDWRSKGPRLW